MAQKPETRFQERVKRRLIKVPNLWLVKAQMVAIRGIPDILFCYRGNFFAWELKVGDNKASKLQAWRIQEIRKAGGHARVVTPENFEQAFKEDICSG